MVQPAETGLLLCNHANSLLKQVLFIQVHFIHIYQYKPLVLLM